VEILALLYFLLVIIKPFEPVPVH